MAFTVETGSGVVGANAYIDLTFALTYHTDRENSFWVSGSGVDDTKRSSAIIRASEYVDKRFGRKFRGWRRTRTQGLEWPRIDAFDNDDYTFPDIPEQLQKAVAEYALRALSLMPLAPDPALSFNTRDSVGTGTTEQASNVQRLRQKVGPIEQDQEFGDSFTSSSGKVSGSTLVNGNMLPSYPEADLWLEELIESSSSRDIVLG